MKTLSRLRLISLAFIILISLPLALFSFSDQTTSERILKENKNFVHFIDICVSNFAGNKTGDFQKAYELHFNADVAYLQADYKRTFKKIRSSQEIMTTLYADVVKDVYLEGAKDILDAIAPGVIQSKNAKARLFLNLGYRDTTICNTFYTVGDASNPKLYSYRIYKYQKAIKYARRAKRYAFLALFESQNTDMKRKIYMHLMKKENEKGTLFFSRFRDLNEKDYIKEMGKNFEEYEEASKAQADDAQKTGASFEKKVEKRVRFRNEKRAARLLINTEFDQAEDIMRNYIEDFNYKLITATFEVLSGASPAEGSENKVGAKVDYNSYKIHLLDNYSRLAKDSVLDTFFGKVSVEDKVDSTAKDDDLDKMKDDEHVVPDDKEATTEEKKEQ